MVVWSYIADFLLGQWLWGVTWDWYHIPVNVVLMCLTFNWLLRISIISSVFLALLAHLYAFAIYSSIVIIGIMWLFNYTYDPFTATPYAASDTLHACIYLGLIYTVLQATFFLLLQKRYKLNLPLTFALTLMCNLVTAFIVSYIIDGAKI